MWIVENRKIWIKIKLQPYTHTYGFTITGIKADCSNMYEFNIL